MEVEAVVVPSYSQYTSSGCMGAIGVFLLVLFFIWLFFGVFSGRGMLNQAGMSCYSSAAPRHYGGATQFQHFRNHKLDTNAQYREEPKSRQKLSTLIESEDIPSEEDDWLQSNLNNMHRETAPRSCVGAVFNSKMPAWNL